MVLFAICFSARGWSWQRRHMHSIVLKVGFIISHGNSRAVDVAVGRETLKRVQMEAHFSGCSHSTASAAAGKVAGR